jgi:hypothetical protein
MSRIIEKQLDNLSASRIIVCEGMGDVYLVNAILKHHKIASCQVGCPSTDGAGGGMGKEKIGAYLDAIKTAAKLSTLKIDGILVIGDADKSEAECVAELNAALVEGGYPTPVASHVVEDLYCDGEPIKIGVYMIPGSNRTGTLEHLLLDSIDQRKKDCIDDFFSCVGIPTDLSPNELAKMKMSSLAAVSCRKNPWASVAYMFQDKGNPVSVASPCFKELSDLLTIFGT